MMRILVLANKIPYPTTDGGALATYNMIMGLSEAGAQISLLAMQTPKHPGPSNGFPIDFQKSIKVHIVDVCTRINPLKAILNLLFSHKPYNAQRFVSSKFSKKLNLLLRSEQFDMVQLEGLYLTPYINIIRNAFTGSIALRAHNVEWEIWQRASANSTNFFKRWYFGLLAKRLKIMEQTALGQIDLLVPITQRDASMLKELGFNGKTFVCQVGYNISFDKADQNDMGFEHPSIFHLGGLDWFPNQEGILWFLKHCWPLIFAKYPDTKFYIAGRNAPKWLVRQIAEHPGVVYCGEVPNAKQFMESKGIMVVPLLTGSGMRVKIVEGMSLGKAIVSTTIGAEGIEAEDGEQLRIADSPDDFVNALEPLLFDRQMIISIGKKAREFAMVNLNNRDITFKLFEFYSQRFCFRLQKH